MLRIVPEQPRHHAAIHDVVTAAFKQPDEALLVGRLRLRPSVFALVAELDGEVAGHVMFSPVTLEMEGRTIAGLGLAPLAVKPALQSRGIGRKLVEEGLAGCRTRRAPYCVLVGSHAYYGRSGFVPGAPLGLRCEWPELDGHLQVLALIPGALDGWRGLVRYDPAFHG